MSNISVTTTQSIIDVTDTSGITVTTPEGQTINVEVPNSSVTVTNTTDEITVLTAGTLNINTGNAVTSVNGIPGPTVVLDTDDISEGTTNKYFSQTLARQSLSAGTGISYDSGTGVITNTSINTDTTYTIASASTTGGANLNLVGSDSSTDSVAYKGSGATTVTSTDANTITIASTDTNTTYTQNASSTTGGANLNLIGSDSTTDSIKLASGTNVTVTRTDADTVTFSSIDTNTTYTQNFSSTTGGTNLNLVSSDSTTDTVKFADGTGVTVAYTDDNTATVSIGQSVGTSDSPSFAGITGGNITVGVSTDNTIASTDTNGNIILDPNGTGNVVMTFANGGNLINDRNYVSGIIRQTAAASAGDVYGFGTGTTNPYRGISLDNTATATTTTGKRTGIVMRNYSNTPRNSIIGEAARGTNPSAPTILTNANVITELVANGYSTASDGTGFQSTGSSISGTTLTIGTVTSGAPAVGQLISSVTQGAVVTAGTTITANISGSGSGSTWTVSTSQTVGSSTIWGGGDGWMTSVNGLAGAIRLVTGENWTNQSSGTNLVVALSPLANASTLALAGATYNALSMNSSTTTLASDSQTFRTKPTAFGGTNFAMLTLAESAVTVGGDLRVNGNDIQNSSGSTNITMTSDRSQTTVTSDLFKVEGASPSTQYFSVGKSFDGDVILGLSHTRALEGYNNALINFQTQRSVDGINYTPTQNGDALGEFKFNGNAYTSTSPGVPGGPGASILASATENWTSTANGTRFDFQAIKTGTLDNYSVITGTPTQLDLNADIITLNDSLGNDLVTVSSTGNITLDPNGSGDIVLTLANGGNLTNSRNYVYGAIRNATTKTNGDVWSFSSGAGSAYRGITLDNSIDTTKRPGIIMRSYGVSGGAPRSDIIMESARGTAASPANLNNGDVLADILSNGYTSTGWVADQVATVPAIARFYTTEAWNNGLNNTGTGFRIILQPTATTLTTSSLITALEVTPIATTVTKQSNVVENRATSSNDYARTNFTTARFSAGSYTPTQSGDAIGEFKFNGNAFSGANFGVPAGPGAAVTAKATELWSNTANGTTINFTAVKTGTISSYDVINATPDQLKLNAGTIQLNDYTGATPLVGNQIQYNRVYGQWQYNATITPAAANTAYVFPIGTQDFGNIASVTNTSRIVLGAAGMYNLQFSVQTENTANSEHIAYIWLRKNGVDIANSTGRITLLKSASGISGWNFVIDSANTTDYYEIAYAVQDTAVIFPNYSATAFCPGTASLVTTVTPIGA